jgi:hypothetical protein
MGWVAAFSSVIRPSAGRVYLARVSQIARWNSARMLLIGAGALFWWLGCEYVQRFGRYSPPSQAIPKPSQTVVSNNQAALLGLPVNLDGTAVVYPQQVDGLVASDGEFRTELSLHEMASALSLDPRTIARPGSKDEIDPDATLFTAVTGRLSEPAKARSRRLREIEYADIQPALVNPDEWLTLDAPFSLNVLRHPNQEQRMILEAISRSARGVMRQPGAAVNAVPVPSLRAGGRPKAVEFAGGYLPLEPLPVDRRTQANPLSRDD